MVKRLLFTKLYLIAAGVMMFYFSVQLFVGYVRLGAIIERNGSNKDLFELMEKSVDGQNPKRDLALEELKKNSSTSVPYLISLLNNFDPAVRYKAIDTLRERRRNRQGRNSKSYLTT